jgi:hypothetical protein
MEYCLRLTQGMGNKIILLVYYLLKYPDNKLYIADQVSVHQKGLPHEKIYYLYPDLLKHPKLKFISFEDYLKLKETMPKLTVSFFKRHLDVPKHLLPPLTVTWDSVFNELSGFNKTSIRKYFKPNLELEYLNKKYDMDNGMFIHFRLGDKFRENIKNLNEGRTIQYILMKPEYYLKHLKNFTGPVYVFSDEIEVARCLLKDDRFQYTNEGTNEAIFCFQHAKHMILSDSTMSISAMKLNSRKYHAVLPGYLIRNLVVKVTPFAIESEKVHIDTDKKLILSKLNEYKQIIKECYE